jgi:prephenate dehydrogenase
MSASDQEPEPCVVVVGVGLIGGSVAAARRRVDANCRIIGLGRNQQRLDAAQAAGLIDQGVTSPSDLPLQGRVLVVVCLPVDMVADAVCDMAALSGPDVLFTDAGSVKRRICEAVAKCPEASARFVGAHPIAGGEQTGFEAASATLFENRCCVVTTDNAPSSQVERVVSFWRSLGSNVHVMDASQHDRVVAVTSHLPHLLASVTAMMLSPADLPFAGTGFRDTTRVAAGDAELWTQILLGNSECVLPALVRAGERLEQLTALIQSRDREQLRALLEEAAKLRKSLPRQ